jgi:hypothetical protein
MTNIVDNLIAVRIIYLLVQPFNKWDAFKEGIIDADGNKIGDSTDSDNWTMLHRLVARLKKILALAPGGKSMIASVAAAYMLVREHVENNTDLNENFAYSDIDTNVSFENYCFVRRTLTTIVEEGEAPTNVVGTGNIAGAGPEEDPPVRLTRKKKDKKNVTNPSVR